MKAKANDGMVGFATIWQLETLRPLLRQRPRQAARAEHDSGAKGDRLDRPNSRRSHLRFSPYREQRRTLNRHSRDDRFVAVRLPQWSRVGKTEPSPMEAAVHQSR